MIGLDAAIEQNSWIDPERLEVFGGSYGGFMTNWVVTQTDRFNAGVSHVSLSNHISFYGTSMYQLLMEYEFGGKPWETHDAYWDRSPIAHVANIRTLLLLLTVKWTTTSRSVRRRSSISPSRNSVCRPSSSATQERDTEYPSLCTYRISYSVTSAGSIGTSSQIDGGSDSHYQKNLKRSSQCPTLPFYPQRTRTPKDS